MPTWLIIDTDYLAHRAKHVFGDLSFEGAATGVIYGVLRDIVNLTQAFNTRNIVFCWDHERRRRAEIYPAYKANRKRTDMDPEERKFQDAYYKQVRLLRDEYLWAIGFRNILQQEGYESDDLIASVCHTLQAGEDDAVVVSADQDLFQLIRSHIDVYNPSKHERLTLQKFIVRYGIHPRQWTKVKAIAGCSTDNIQGIQGVGEKTAIKYLLNQLKPSTKAYHNIKKGWKTVVMRNKKLVKLPLLGTMTWEPVTDHVTQRGWDEVTRLLGMKRIRWGRL